MLKLYDKHGNEYKLLEDSNNVPKTNGHKVVMNWNGKELICNIDDMLDINVPTKISQIYDDVGIAKLQEVEEKQKFESAVINTSLGTEMFLFKFGHFVMIQANENFGLPGTEEYHIANIPPAFYPATAVVKREYSFASNELKGSNLWTLTSIGEVKIKTNYPSNSGRSLNVCYPCL